ncbi:hypothetical protein DICVIV_03320 [Dictyocaulus viviparus]|uniref:Uncharacterized protein n=1 Tax=Dictyocaulus viviparus TaxID=29172 RepID=A0A0D8Y3F1_DICVI|nr:hypothetical protein DICVIV_03320 [Dictyocaulus viviparus]
MNYYEECCSSHGYSDVDSMKHNEESIMEFYRAERIRVLSMRQPVLTPSKVSTTLKKEMRNSVEEKMEIVNDENLYLELSRTATKTSVLPYKRCAQSGSPLLNSNIVLYGAHVTRKRVEEALLVCGSFIWTSEGEYRYQVKNHWYNHNAMNQSDEDDK